MRKKKICFSFFLIYLTVIFSSPQSLKAEETNNPSPAPSASQNGAAPEIEGLGKALDRYFISDLALLQAEAAMNDASTFNVAREKLLEAKHLDYDYLKTIVPHDSPKNDAERLWLLTDLLISQQATILSICLENFDFSTPEKLMNYHMLSRKNHRRFGKLARRTLERFGDDLPGEQRKILEVYRDKGRAEILKVFPPIVQTEVPKES